MAFDLVPPPPPSAPLSYSPPSDELEVAIDLNVFEPIKDAMRVTLRYIETSKIANNPSTPYYIASGLHDILFNEYNAPLWELFPSQPTTPDVIFAELNAIRAVLSGTTPNQDPHPTAHPDTVALATLGRKIDELKKETNTSLKSFAEAVKAPTHQPPPINPTTKPKTKNPQPPPRGERLPQAVIRFQGRVDPKSRPSFTELVPLLNSSLCNNKKFSHVKVVGVKWTPASNLVVRAQAPSPSVLVTALKAVQASINKDHLIVKDVIPNTRWSRMTLSHVYTGKEPHSSCVNPEDIHEELTQHNPNYAQLTIRQLPTWLRNPSSFKDSQVSSVSFAFEDQDGSIARRLTGTTLTAFGNLRCTLKNWIPKISHKEAQPPPGDSRGKSPAPPTLSTR
jgi:hypothetical protein